MGPINGFGVSGLKVAQVGQLASGFSPVAMLGQKTSKQEQISLSPDHEKSVSSESKIVVIVACIESSLP